MKTAFSKAIEILAPWFWNGGESINLPVECLKAPPPEWQCREVDPTHVKELTTSIKNNPLGQMLAEPCGVVIFDLELSKANQNSDISEEDLLEYLYNNPAATYHGEHRRQAMSGLHAVCILLK
jgi:hypothetical protein